MELNQNKMLKNYASTSPIPNIFNAIEKTLTSHKAKQIVRDFDDNGRIVAISFLVETSKGPLGIKLPARFDKVEKIFQEQGIRYKEDQPYRAAWATIRDWVDSQMALIDWEMVKLEEVFLPYATNNKGQTFFEIVEESSFKLLSVGIEEGEVVE